MSITAVINQNKWQLEQILLAQNGIRTNGIRTNDNQNKYYWYKMTIEKMALEQWHFEYV